MTKPDKITNGTAISGTIANGPAISEMIQMKKKINGISTTAIKVADVKNSRKVSNSPYYTTLVIMGGISSHGETAAFWV